MTDEQRQEQQQTRQKLLTTAKETQALKAQTLAHAVIVLFILGSATALRAAHELDVQTISTVYGAALGYATGLTVRGGDRGA